MIRNPFPGPQPYRSADRDRFYGREEMSYRLDKTILAHRCVTVYGPSGAGKSSLVQASVIPSLVEAHEIDVVRVDAWPPEVNPTRWLADAMYNDLDLGATPPDLTAEQAILTAAQRVARRSPNLVLLYLDQIEQLLHTTWRTEEIEAFFACLGGVVDLPFRNLRVLLSLREDYLGRFRDRLREHRRLLDHGFRVGPLCVAEISAAVCQAAATGDPPQEWALEPTRTLMLQVRVPGQPATEDAEAQAAYAQIVCRALFRQRTASDGASGESEAETVLRSYLETTLDALGSLRSSAQRLLEEHLVTADGTRTLRTEQELLRLLPEKNLSPILQALEGAAILHAEEHQGSRYFEIGHDWLARRVFEQRQQRVREEEQRRVREEAEAKLAKERAQRRRLAAVAVVLLGIAAAAAALAFWAFQQKREAEYARQLAVLREQEADQARNDAEEQKRRAEELRKRAEKEKNRAEAEAQKAQEAAEAAQQARGEAQDAEKSARASEAQARTAAVKARDAEAVALFAEAKARVEERKANKAAEAERRRKEALEKLIERAAGKIDSKLK